MNTTTFDRPLSIEALVAQKLMAETLQQFEVCYDAVPKHLPAAERAAYMKDFAIKMQLAVEQVYLDRRDLSVLFLDVHQRPFGFDVLIACGVDPAKKFRFMMTESQIVCKQMA